MVVYDSEFLLIFIFSKKLVIKIRFMMVRINVVILDSRSEISGEILRPQNGDKKTGQAGIKVEGF
jgi:hypothetical protein